MTRAQPIQALSFPATSSPRALGPAVAKGPAGPAGPPRTLFVVERADESVEVSPGFRAGANAPCLPGEFATGGGYAYIPTTPNIALTVDTQVALGGNTGWAVHAVNNSAVPILLTAFDE